MPVSIIGAGSIGLLFAAYLQKANIDVTVYTRTKEQEDTINSEGLYLSLNDSKQHFKIRAKVLTPEELINDEIIIVTVKQYQLNDIKQILRKNSKGKIFLFVQNGLGHLSLLSELDDCQTFLGIVEHGAKKLSANRVVHTGVGKTNVAYFPNNEKLSAPSFLKSWHQQNFPIAYQEDWREMAIYKLVANAVINPLTAIFRVTNGKLLSNQYLLQLMRAICNETVEVLQLNAEHVWEYVVNICEQTAKNESSMNRDIQAGRLTEIDAISGYIIEKAKAQKMSAPYTTFVYNSIKALEYENRLTGKKEGRQNVN